MTEARIKMLTSAIAKLGRPAKLLVIAFTDAGMSVRRHKRAFGADLAGAISYAAEVLSDTSVGFVQIDDRDSEAVSAEICRT